MPLKMQRISLPKTNPYNKFVTYENGLQPKMDFCNSWLQKFYHDNEKDILTVVENEIESYVNTDNLCNDDVGMFPCRSTLTGEWYLRSIYFESMKYLSVSAALLGNSLGFKDDYLGLEVILQYDEQQQKLVVIGINSASI